jgi:hypothetical protein
MDAPALQWVGVLNGETARMRRSNNDGTYGSNPNPSANTSYPDSLSVR